MRHLVYCSVVCCVLLAVSPALGYYAGTAWFSDSWGNGNGGEFVCHPSGNWSAHRINEPIPDFETFCVEKNEYVILGTPQNPKPVYNVDFDKAAILGGIGGGNPDPLDPRTAWLYCEFIKGTLTNYYYPIASPTDQAKRIASADALQDVIWVIEQEMAPNWTLGDNSLRDQFYTMSIGKSADCTWVMNLWAPNGPNGDPIGHGNYNSALDRWEYQSQLVCIPAPAATLLGAFGLGLVGWVKRRLT